MTHVLGFHVQCAVCPQRAFVATQPDKDWICPRCQDLSPGFGDVDVAQAEPYQHGGLTFVTEADPLAEAIMAELGTAGPAAKVTATVGDRVFMLGSFTENRDGLLTSSWYDRAELAKKCALPRCPVCQKLVGQGLHTEDGSPVCRKPIHAYIPTDPPTPITFTPQPTAHSPVGEFDLVGDIGEFGVLCACTEVFWAAGRDTAEHLHLEHSLQHQQAGGEDDEYPIGQVQG